ncbi:ABC transporter permease subunit [Jeotgalibacillus sp. ET6]|uniref:ABC transporter permease subunit n=1 Tax=Jeotgalibacillus sp. ET6 TaxID=3037260 RepID=UPI0024183F1B|nr:ABC transporter permease subunit [Jeotgalibacillus sp. ET6]MDG5471375.1 ABC transporter permease subunit [Jeotgalibacillus sp. ET6]
MSFKRTVKFMYSVYWAHSLGMVKERTGETLERLLMTPIKRGEVILGYTIGFGVFVVVQAIFIVLVNVFDQYAGIEEVQEALG